MAIFVCSCENKTYAGFFNNKPISINPDCEICGGDEIMVDENNDAPQITVMPCPKCLPEFHN